MNKIFFYIIIISQSWLSIGTFCAHIINPDHILVEIFGEEEKNEKEIETEKEVEKINQSQDIYNMSQNLFSLQTRDIEYPLLAGRNHTEVHTPPPRKS